MTHIVYLLSLFLLLSPVHALGDDAKLTFYTEHYPPLNYKSKSDKKIKGISVDVVRELMQRTGFNYEIKLTPWKRGYELTLAHKNTCLFTTGRTSEREMLFKWITPLSDISLVLFSRKDRIIKLKTLEEAHNYRIGGYLGDVTVDYLLKNDIAVETVPNDRLNLKKLQNGRIDLWATGEIAGLKLAQEMKDNNIQIALRLVSVPGGIACNLQLSDIIIVRLQQELRKLYEEGFIERTYQAHMPELSRPEH